MKSSGYYIDLNDFSLAKLKSLLNTTRLLPSQEILKQDIDERFACLGRQGIENLHQLQKRLKTKSDVASFANISGLPLEYLTILRREVNSYQPKPINLKDFPGVNPEVTQKLAQLDIKNTRQLFPHVLDQDSRTAFANKNHFHQEDILELTKLTDVARTKWVGPKFARLLVESEYDTVEKIANSKPKELYQNLVHTNEEHNIYGGKFGLEDLASWVNVVRQVVPLVIQY